jgi:hypothetical protein
MNPNSSIIYLSLFNILNYSSGRVNSINLNCCLFNDEEAIDLLNDYGHTVYHTLPRS